MEFWIWKQENSQVWKMFFILEGSWGNQNVSQASILAGHIVRQNYIGDIWDAELSNWSPKDRLSRRLLPTAEGTSEDMVEREDPTP